jgi:predicted AlkP superfamily phosphohydrolase/phosphomutase
MFRRDFIRVMGTSAGAAILPSCSGRGTSPATGRVLVVAFDGMDPRVVQSLMDSGRLPNLERLRQRGSFRRLATTTPPQTPVAFSSIITGADPGLHQIFDFIHRDPRPTTEGLAIRPYLSTADGAEPETQWALSLGDWRMPLAGGQTLLLRQGTPFWEHLVQAGIDTDIYYVPANYPQSVPAGPGRFRSISGMGTPDLLGSYGEFTLFGPDVALRGKRVGGGRFVHLSMLGHHGRAELPGPHNILRDPDSAEPMNVTVNVVRDPENGVAKIDFSGNSVLLAEGEWSGWLPVTFQTGIPGAALLRIAQAPTALRGMVRIYLKSVHPKLVIYCSPINIDPLAPVNSISTPAGYSRQLARSHGRFHTLGIPEDTKALSHGALNEDEFLQQAETVTQERQVHFRSALQEFEQGCLFFYFGETDLVQHMFWRDRDPEHPGRDAAQGDQYAHVVDDIYGRMDQIVGESLDALEEQDTLIVLSDHGFTSFRRGFNLNSWLLDNGFLGLSNPSLQGRHEMFVNVDWSRARAYGLGMNGLYVNLRGREKHGTVDQGAMRGVLNEIRDKLLEVRDVDGRAVVSSIDLVADTYPGADPLVAPDMIVGYNDGYRASWDTVLGKMPRGILEDNLDRWSGTHLIEAAQVPGILFANRVIDVEEPSVLDIAPTILHVFGISPPVEMSGQALFS